MFSVLLLAFTALASDVVLVPEFPDGSKRSVKIDLFYFAPGVHPYGSDWTPSLLEQWTAALDCEQVRGRVERCTFRDDTLWWGYVAEGGPQELTWHRLPTPGALELMWTPRGKLASWDVIGDRDGFHERASNAMLALYHRKDVVWRPDAQRRIGASMEQALCRGFASVLELELPKKGKTDAGTWTSKSPPWAARRYVQGTSTGKFSYELGGDATVPVVAWKGTMSEAPPAGSLDGYFVEGEAIGEMVLDPATRRVKQARVETAYRSTSTNLSGHTRFIGIATPMPSDQVVEPTPFGGPLLK